MNHFDLHTHTSHSDGALSPFELLSLAREQGVTHLAITDHDTVAAHRQLAQSNNHSSVDNIQVITGIELSSQWSKVGVHIVGLNVDIDSPAMVAAENYQADVRMQRLERIACKLSKLGFDNLVDGSLAKANGAQVGRPHISQYMVSQGMVNSRAEAFNKYLGAGKVGDVTALWPSLQQVVKWITGSGGIAVLAHPGCYRLTRSKRIRLIGAFKDAGGRALEVCTGNQPHGLSEDMSLVCEKMDLLASVGSDFHAPDYPWVKLGQYPKLPSRCRPVWHAMGF